VWPASVVLLEIPLENTFEMPPVPDQRPVQTLGSDGSNPAFGVRVGPRIQLHRMRRIGSDVSG
jgi:hypothetical protein